MRLSTCKATAIYSNQAGNPVSAPNTASKLQLFRVVSTIQIQHTESYRCVLRAIGIEKQVSQPHIVSKTIAANRFESYRFVSVSVGVCFEGPFGARRAAASCCCAGGCLAREALENRLRLLQADSMLNTSQGSSGQLQPAEARNQPNSAS